MVLVATKKHDTDASLKTIVILACYNPNWHWQEEEVATVWLQHRVLPHNWTQKHEDIASGVMILSVPCNPYL